MLNDRFQSGKVRRNASESDRSDSYAPHRFQLVSLFASLSRRMCSTVLSDLRGRTDSGSGESIVDWTDKKKGSAALLYSTQCSVASLVTPLFAVQLY